MPRPVSASLSRPSSRMRTSGLPPPIPMVTMPVTAKYVVGLRPPWTGPSKSGPRSPPKCGRRDAGSLGRRGQFVPNNLRCDVLAASERTKATVGAGDDPLLVADSRHRLSQTARDDEGVLDKVRRCVDYAGNEQH